MTVAYILKMYPRFSETFILNEILELERQGLDVQIFSLVKPDDGRFHAKLAKVQAKVTYLPEYPTHHGGEPVRTACWNLFRRDAGKFLSTLWYSLMHSEEIGLKQFLRATVLADALMKKPVDHMHAHFASSAAGVALIAHLFTGIPYSFTAHAKDIYINSVDQDLLRDKMQAAQFVVTVSDFNRQHLLDVAQKKNKRAKLIQSSIPSGAYRPQVLRLYNGIDLDQFNPKANRVLESGRTPLILSVGRLVEKKGFEDLIRACGILRDKGLNFRCEIIGKGPREAAIRELISQLNLNNHVRLLGAKPQDDVVAIYEQATVFALPCIVAEDGNRDGLPTVLLEAMAMGLPTVSTNLTGVPEIIDDESTGLLVPPQDPPALASALTRLLSDMALGKSMGDAARIKVAREFDLRQNVSTLHGWLNDSTEGKKTKTDQIVRTEILKDSVYENTLSVR